MNLYNEPLPTCQICGYKCLFPSAKLCNGCYEVERNLESYISTPKGLERVQALLKEQQAKTKLVTESENKGT